VEKLIYPGNQSFPLVVVLLRIIFCKEDGQEMTPVDFRKNVTVDHLLSAYSVARLMWNILQCLFKFRYVPDTGQDLLNSWLVRFMKKDKKLITMEIAAVFWTI
jgi:hypothetical protein